MRTGLLLKQFVQAFLLKYTFWPFIEFYNWTAFLIFFKLLHKNCINAFMFWKQKRNEIITHKTALWALFS